MDCQGLTVVFLQHMAVSIGFEPMRPFLNGGLAIRCITTLPTHHVWPVLEDLNSRPLGS